MKREHRMQFTQADQLITKIVLQVVVGEIRNKMARLKDEDVKGGVAEMLELIESKADEIAETVEFMKPLKEEVLTRASQMREKDEDNNRAVGYMLALIEYYNILKYRVFKESEI